MEEVLVFIVLGFLDSGKTKYIQETLEKQSDTTDEKVMLLVCEEGEEEFQPEKISLKNFVVVTLESADELTLDNLEYLTAKHKPQRVIVEYNGTWLLQQFFEAMPESWVIDQMLTLVDSATFMNYNANMRQLVFDKIQMTQLVAFNRFKDEYDKTAFHKAVRGITRRADIIYEYENGEIVKDDIYDPLPYDINAPVVKIEDRDFAWFYSDLNENMPQYVGKTVEFKGLAAVTKKAPKGYVVLGRHIMTCCEADIQYCGLAVDAGGYAEKIGMRDWVRVTGKIKFQYNSLYRSEGPVVVAEKIEPCDPPEEKVATYY